MLENEVAESLGMNAHGHDNPTTLLKSFPKARLLIRGVMRVRHPHASVSSDTAPPPVPKNPIVHSDTALVHRLCSNFSLKLA